MTRLYKAILIVVVFPLLLTAGIFFYTSSLQPDYIGTYTAPVEFTTYFDLSKYQTFSGSMRFYPGELYSSVPDSTVPYSTISYTSEIFTPSSVVDSNYRGTLVFYLNLPSAYEYGLIMPTQFCEYQVIVNGSLLGQSSTYLSKIPAYGSPKYFRFPISDSGEYEVIIDINSPTNYSSGHDDIMLFGTHEVMLERHKTSETVSLTFACLLLFLIVFCAIQAYTIRTTSLHLAYFFFSATATLSIFFTDGNIIMKFIPVLPYQVGIILRSLSSPLFGISLVYLAYAMFKDCFPVKLANFFAILQIIPIISMLCFEQVPLLVTLSSLITTLPFAICMYVFIFSYERREPYSLSYGIAVLLVESSVLSSFATEDLLVPARFTYALGLGAFSIIEIIVLAKRYSGQYRNELFYANELSSQLENMQASENAFLNAQMKPHFLYNTLNTIADLCVTDSPKAKSLIGSLEEYLKLILSLDNMQETVSLKRELEIAERYIEIEGRRFPSIQFYKEYPLRMPTVYMPPIVIQPLIENAIKHGVRKLDRPGIITLRIEENHNSVTFLVSDNGDGMEQATIDKMFERPKENKSIGIYNIDKRLKNKYGRGLTVESTKGLGTSVSFTIPKGDNQR